MSAVYLTTMGSLYSGDGINVNAIATGDDGWIYELLKVSLYMAK